MAAEYRMPSGTKGLVIAIALIAFVISLINDATVVVLALPILIGLGVMVVSSLPLRYSMFGLTFMALTLPNPIEGFPWAPWTAPFERFGWAMLSHINTIDRSMGAISWCSFSGMDIMFAALGLITYQRRQSRSKLDFKDAEPTPKPLTKLAHVSLLATAFVWIGGLVRGGDFRMSLWQLNSVMYLPIIFLLYQAALRGPKDHVALLKVLLAAAVYRSLFATFVMHSFKGPLDPETGSTKLPFASSHADSMLFADAFVAIVVIFLERAAKKKSKMLLAALVPIIGLGMINNNRRLVWVHVGIALLTVYLITADSPLKRRIRRGLVALAPVALAYAVAGWNSQYGGFFKPIRTLRTVVDAKSDNTGSSFWRELENFDLVETIRANPIFGVGYGHGYNEVVKLPDVDYALELYCPHNSILGLWAYCGYVGFIGTTLLWVAGVFFAMRAYRRATLPTQRAAALMSIIGVLVYVMHCWGDLGLGTWTGAFTCAASLAIGAKLAPNTGAWGSKPAPVAAAGGASTAGSAPSGAPGTPPFTPPGSQFPSRV